MARIYKVNDKIVTKKYFDWWNKTIQENKKKEQEQKKKSSSPVKIVEPTPVQNNSQILEKALSENQEDRNKAFVELEKISKQKFEEELKAKNIKDSQGRIYSDKVEDYKIIYDKYRDDRSLNEELRSGRGGSAVVPKGTSSEVSQNLAVEKTASNIMKKAESLGASDFLEGKELSLTFSNPIKIEDSKSNVVPKKDDSFLNASLNSKIGVITDRQSFIDPNFKPTPEISYVEQETFNPNFISASKDLTFKKRVIDQIKIIPSSKIEKAFTLLTGVQTQRFDFSNSLDYVDTIGRGVEKSNKAKAFGFGVVAGALGTADLLFNPKTLVETGKTIVTKPVSVISSIRSDIKSNPVFFTGTIVGDVGLDLGVTGVVSKGAKTSRRFLTTDVSELVDISKKSTIKREVFQYEADLKSAKVTLEKNFPIQKKGESYGLSNIDYTFKDSKLSNLAFDSSVEVFDTKTKSSVYVKTKDVPSYFKSNQKFTTPAKDISSNILNDINFNKDIIVDKKLKIIVDAPTKSKDLLLSSAIPFSDFFDSSFTGVNKPRSDLVPSSFSSFDNSFSKPKIKSDLNVSGARTFSKLDSSFKPKSDFFAFNKSLLKVSNLNNTGFDNKFLGKIGDSNKINIKNDFSSKTRNDFEFTSKNNTVFDFISKPKTDFGSKTSPDNVFKSDFDITPVIKLPDSNNRRKSFDYGFKFPKSKRIKDDDKPKKSVNKTRGYDAYVYKNNKIKKINSDTLDKFSARELVKSKLDRTKSDKGFVKKSDKYINKDSFIGITYGFDYKFSFKGNKIIEKKKFRNDIEGF